MRNSTSEVFFKSNTNTTGNKISKNCNITCEKPDIALKKAFTLLELLVSTAILTILISSAWFSFSSVQRAASHGNVRYDFLREVTIATKELKKLLQNASPYLQIGKDTSFKGTSSSIEFTTIYRKDNSTPQQFITINSESSGLVISYDSLRWLLRKKGQKLTNKRTTGNTTSQATNKTFSIISDASFKYSDGKDENWKDEWEVSKKGKLPLFIQTALTFKTDKGQTMTYKQIISTKLEKDTNSIRRGIVK